ncbi:MAG: ligase-associated DNA damage response endonuclease PdeM [Casimicrobiaceae bacterium]
MKSTAPPSSQDSRSSRSLLDAPLRDAGSASAVDALATVVGGEAVTLFADRALYWPRERTLFIADVHLGKTATFRAHGVPMPRGVTATDLARLTALIARSGATRVVVLGDLLHARAGRVAALDATVEAWRDTHRETAIVLIRGNHDAHAGDPPAAWAIDCRADPYAMPPFLACHAPVSPPSGYALCGHLHPGVRLHGSGEESARLPCFVLGERHAILPAFGRFTGLAMVAPSPELRIVAIAGSTLFALPRPPSTA